MDEDILDVQEPVEENFISDTESLETDTLHGNDGVESVSNSLGSDGFNDGTSDVVSHFDEEMGGYPVYIINSEEEEPETLAEDDVMLAASYSDYYSYLPTQIEDYVSGILANMKDTDYVAFAYRHYNNDYNNSYTDYYRLVYDVELQDGSFISGEYPCIQISKDSSYSSSYVQTETRYNMTAVPDFAYGSFGHLSDLRKGVSHDETYTFLFFAGFAVVYVTCSSLFNFILRKYKS